MPKENLFLNNTIFFFVFPSHKDPSFLDPLCALCKREKKKRKKSPLKKRVLVVLRLSLDAVGALNPGVGADGRIGDEIVENSDPRVMMREIVVVFRSDSPHLT